MISDIRLDNITKLYAGKPALKGLSLTLAHGEASFISGESGCGKTTLLRLLAGLERADEGEITGVAGRRLAVCFQEDRLIGHLSAVSNCLIVLSGRRERERVARALCELGLEHALDRPAVRSFSGGMARRVALARCMLADADTVLLDEPFKGLDADNRARARDFVMRMSKGKTLIAVSHDPDDALAFGARAITLLAPAHQKP